MRRTIQEPERMRAILRGTVVLLAGAVWLAPAAALAQGTTVPAPSQATTNTPATDAVGPSELQNFNLKGTVTRPADQPPASTQARPQTAPVPTPSRSAQTRTAPPAAAPARRTAATAGSSPPLAAPQPVQNAPPPNPAITAAPVAVAPATTAPLADVASPPADTLAPARKFPFWPG